MATKEKKTKPQWQCNYCGFIGTIDEVQRHIFETHDGEPEPEQPEEEPDGNRKKDN